MRYVSLLVVGMFLCVSTNAFGHGGGTISINVGVVNGQLAITNGMDVNGLRVFADNAEKFDGLGQSIVPGWNVDGALASSTLRLNVIDELLFWNTTSGTAATTGDALSLRRLFFPAGLPDVATVSMSSIVDANTLVWDAATVGQSHHIMRYEVPAGAANGAYGVLLQVEDVSATSNFGSTQPFLLVLNKGLTSTPSSTVPGQPLYPADTSEFGRAVFDIAAIAVPEPSGFLLAVLGVAAMGWCLQRARAKPQA